MIFSHYFKLFIEIGNGVVNKIKKGAYEEPISTIIKLNCLTLVLNLILRHD